MFKTKIALGVITSVVAASVYVISPMNAGAQAGTDSVMASSSDKSIAPAVETDKEPTECVTSAAGSSCSRKCDDGNASASCAVGQTCKCTCNGGASCWCE